MDNHQMTLPKILFLKQLNPIWPQLLQPFGLPTKKTLRSSLTVLLLSLDSDKVGLGWRLAILLLHSQHIAPQITPTHMKLKILHAILESINSHLRFSTFPTHSIHQTDYLVRVELCCENLPYCGTWKTPKVCTYTCGFQLFLPTQYPKLLSMTPLWIFVCVEAVPWKLAVPWQSKNSKTRDKCILIIMRIQRIQRLLHI